ncbi:hypothetical protein DOTSEDRAFT_32761 [Dothistroma septosporum NZE10]|uniref:Uncharacterized protein n=1 Tax=Dothistroma septosporum (strain NZE10 / CBS 128990) TaxID=675120 RepID=N1PUP4_DOTSN|nr:hypothetical protein DOTSEDRAFT_32761 [Dothistroma septosporum NZE10]
MRNGLPYRTFPIELSLGTRGKTRGIQCEQNSRRYAGVPYTLNGQTWEWTRFPLPIRLPQRSKKLSLLMSGRPRFKKGPPTDKFGALDQLCRARFKFNLVGTSTIMTEVSAMTRILLRPWASIEQGYGSYLCCDGMALKRGSWKSISLARYSPSVLVLVLVFQRLQFNSEYIWSRNRTRPPDLHQSLARVSGEESFSGELWIFQGPDLAPSDGLESLVVSVRRWRDEADATALDKLEDRTLAIVSGFTYFGICRMLDVF